MVSPGSSAAKRQAESEGLDKIFLAAGLEWRDSGVRCATDRTANWWRRASAAPRRQIAITKAARGAAPLTHIMSPAMVAARLSPAAHRCPAVCRIDHAPLHSPDGRRGASGDRGHRYRHDPARPLHAPPPPPGHDYAEAFLYDLRFEADGRRVPTFVLNAPAYAKAEILVPIVIFG